MAGDHCRAGGDDPSIRQDGYASRDARKFFVDHNPRAVEGRIRFPIRLESDEHEMLCAVSVHGGLTREYELAVMRLHRERICALIIALHWLPDAAFVPESFVE